MNETIHQNPKHEGVQNEPCATRNRPVQAAEISRRDLADLIHRLSELAVAGRHEVHQWLVRDLRLESAEMSSVDRELAARSHALEAIRAVAQELGLPRGTWPTARQFDAAAHEYWSVKQVIKAWGRWQSAIDALKQARPQKTRAQKANLSRVAGRREPYAPAVEAVREWLKTDPVDETSDSYEEWVRLQNERAVAGAQLMPGHSALRDQLSLPFGEIVRVAKRQIELKDANRSTPAAKPTWSSGPHAFVSRPDLAHMLGRSKPQINTLVARSDFPQPVIVLSRTPAWLLEDVEAWREGRPVPLRERDCLRAEYLNVEELASRLGVSPAAVRQPNAHAPKPTAAICGKHLWHRPSVDLWFANTQPSPYSGRRRKNDGNSATRAGAA